MTRGGGQNWPKKALRNSDEENDALLSMIRSVAENERSLLWVGDFNYPRINWDELDVSGDGEAFLNIIEDNFLCQHVTQGFNNIGESMELGGKLLASHTSERDLGVIVQSNLKVDMQCNKAACEANRRLGMIKRNFRFKSKSVMLPLYKSIVRPHLDYCMQAWRPH